MAVRAAAQHHEVEVGQLDSLLGGKKSRKLLLIQVRRLLGIALLGSVLIDVMYGWLSQFRWDLAEQFVPQEAEVAVRVFEGDNTFVGEENMPFRKLDFVFGGAVSGRDQCLSEDAGEGASGDCDSKVTMTVYGIVLAAQEVNPQLLGKVLGVREGIEIVKA